MYLQTWLEKRSDAVSRELLHRLRRDEGYAVGGDDPNLLGLDTDSVCGEIICRDVVSTAKHPGDSIDAAATELHDRARVVLYG